MTRRPLVALALLATLAPALAESGWLQPLEALLQPDEDAVGGANAAASYAALAAQARAEDVPGLLEASLTFADKGREQGAALAADLVVELARRGEVGDPAALTSFLRAKASPLEQALEAYAALPWSACAPVLSACLSDPAPHVRARAGRFLAELAPLGSASDVAACLAPLASDADPGARLAYVQALETLDADLTQAGSAVAALASDTAWAVAVHAMRLASARGLLAALPAARARAADTTVPYPVRLAACWTLARCGDPALDGALLRDLLPTLGLEDQEVALTCWARLDPSHAAPAVAAAIEAQPLEPGSYRAIPALGVDGAGLVLRNLSLDPKLPALPEEQLYDRRISTLEALARGPSHPVLAELLYRFCLQEPAEKPTELGPNPQEFQLALRGLVAQANEHARELLANLVLKRRREGQLPALVDAVAQLGGPRKHRGLATHLAHELSAIDVTALGLEVLTGHALARVDPALARAYAQKRLASEGGDGLDWTRLLARYGDPKPLLTTGLPLSRARWEKAAAGERRTARFVYGLDLLSAGRYEATVDAFRQVLRTRPGPSAAYNVACAYALAGEHEHALRWLRRTQRLGYADPTHMQLDLDLVGLHPDPRFQRLIAALRAEAQVGLPVLDRAL